jgi:PAS domain-containing protein
MKIDYEKLDASMNNFLEAAIAPQQSPEMLQKVAEATGSDGIILIPVSGRAPGFPASEPMQEVLNAYFSEGWHLNDFRERGVAHMLKHGSALEQDFATEDDIQRNSYYRFLAKYNMRWSLILKFYAGDDPICFVTQRFIQSGPFEREEERLLRRIQNRLTLSGSVFRAISDAKIDGVADAFDHMDLACVFFDRQGKVTRLNAAAQMLVGNEIDVVGGDLVGASGEESAALRRQILASTKAIVMLDQDINGPIRLGRSRNRRLVARVQRLTGGLADIFTHSIGLVVISDMDARLKKTLDILRTIYGLTPREAKIAALLAEGQSLR